MVQTEIGAGRNEWISYMRECSSLYQARKEAERATTEGPVKTPVVDKVKRAKVVETKRAKRVRKE